MVYLQSPAPASGLGRYHDPQYERQLRNPGEPTESLQLLASHSRATRTQIEMYQDYGVLQEYLQLVSLYSC